MTGYIVLYQYDNANKKLIWSQFLPSKCKTLKITLSIWSVLAKDSQEKKVDVHVWVKAVLASYVHTCFITSNRCLQYNLPQHFYWHIFTTPTLQYSKRELGEFGRSGGLVFHSDPRHLDGVPQRYSLNNNMNIYIYDAPLRQTWFCSGPLGRIAT